MDKEDKSKFSVLIDSFFRMNYSPKVRARFYAWLLRDKDRERKEEVMLEKFTTYDIPADDNVKKALLEVHQKIGITNTPEESGKAKRIPIGRRLLRVAAVVLPIMVFAGGMYYFKGTSSIETQPELLSISTRTGEKQNITLPDHSQVWVNSGSTVKYPKENEGNKRLVELSGEAYFVVEKDAEKPFVVKTQQLSVTVTGTEFDVKEVPGGNMTIVTLVTGKVNVKTAGGQIYSLEPNQQLTHYHLSGKAEIAELKVAQTEKASIWKNDRLVFEDVGLVDMMQGIETYFNVRIDYSAITKKDHKQYTIRFNPGEDLTSVLKVLKELTGSFNYRIEGQTVYMTDN